MLIIDRFEGEWAVVEYQKKTFNFPKELLPSQAKEGDVIEINVLIDAQGTRSRAEKIKKLADELFED
ncbi:MAG: DUF3006 domain-containing protein [Syntrophomonadaceae bacterium]|nr:DUF3006 domain-containing protein [Syntrophomonadaceae bacterium]